MLIEIGSPASLPLGLVKFEHDQGSKICLLGLTVQHPPVQLFAEAGKNLLITGPRADVAFDDAMRFLAHHQLPHQGEVEIEFAIPNLVGLGSEALLGMSTARALGWVHDLPDEARTVPAFAPLFDLEPRQALEVWGFERGGLLLIDLEVSVADGMPTLLRRQEIEHTEKEAWAFVFYFPDATDDLPETFEAERWAALLAAARHLSSETGRLVDEALWPAVENDDIESFGKCLLALHHLNEAALIEAGVDIPLSPHDQEILDLMRDNGAVAWGRNLTGLSFYGLIKGGQASRELRKTLRKKVGFFGGTVMATITDNRGAVEKIHAKSLADEKPAPIRLNPQLNRGASGSE